MRTTSSGLLAGSSRHRLALGPLLSLLLGWAAACSGSDAPAAGDAGRDAAGDARTDGGEVLAVPVCAWDSRLPELNLPSDEVKSVLRGSSRNASTTCTRQKGAGGPEALYVLRVTTPSVVDLTVTSSIDTVVAIRRACDDPLTEVACNDDPVGFDGPAGADAGAGGFGPNTPLPGVPISPVDAGAPVPTSVSRDAHVRVALDPGVYFVLVDEAAAHGVGGSYTLRLVSSALPSQARCAGGQPVADGTRLLNEQLDIALEAAPTCGPMSPGRALFYTARIPSGQRLTVRASGAAGDRVWLPVIQLLSSCAASACLGTDISSPSGGTERLLRYVNNGPDELPVTIAVSPTVPVTGGLVTLDFTIAEPTNNASCTTARPVVDGQVLRNQDLAEGGSVQTNTMCKPSGGTSLFYKASLLPRQTLNLFLTPHSTQFPGFFLFARESCDALNCNGGSINSLSVVNNSGAPKTYVVEISSIAPGFPGVFDMKVELPLPPGGVKVAPLVGTTSESGGSATFTVVLEAPPRDVVTVPFTSTDPKEGTVSPQSLRFDPSNWDKPQTVTVTGVDDTQADGSRSYRVMVGPTASPDPRYQGLDPLDVELVNNDDEPGFTFTVPQPVMTSESGYPLLVGVALNRAPTATVRLPVRSSNEAEAKVAPAELVFEPSNWATAQTVTVTGVDDATQDGNQAFKIVVGPVTSADPQYGGLDPEDLSATNLDNDFRPLAPRVISGNLVCPFSAQDQRIAADEGGILYVMLGCLGGSSGSGTGGASGGSGTGGIPGVAVDAGAAPPKDPMGPSPTLPPPPSSPMGPSSLVMTSLDGGATFSSPINTGLDAFEVRMVGLSPGVAVAVGAGPRGMVVTRTENAGASWSAPVVLAEQTGFFRLAAAGKRVVIALRTSGDMDLISSDDGGKSFTTFPGALGPLNTIGLGVDAAGAVWSADLIGQLSLRKSTDGGKTFALAGMLPPDFFGETVAFGPKSLFAAGKDTRLLVAPLDKLEDARRVNGLAQLQMFQRVLVPDGGGGVTVLDGDDAVFSEVVARRLETGATSFSSAQSLGTAETTPSGAALGNKAVAALIQKGGNVWLGVTAW